MDIDRILPSDRWSEAIVHNNVLYFTAVPEIITNNIEIQMQSLLDSIDDMLKRVGSDRSRILDATIFLTDKKDLSGMNKIWDKWVIAGSAPVRCTVIASLVVPEYLVEMKITAAI
ncbi:RidA family protein [Thorsellia anophelis]|uniref:Enamine deaminase RidA, house cleaning of reactive enamine intermediates, YjgF/YER057c/UK114 family n=1 Tax=Thorsellia anophelis DSM 18579 TaxID=1123402 RepID=A0A1I0DZV7_9GAMM|nr:RidA family protein [Thorsellia anophelis]SET37584.1 Enamine deaminase RidA, house cleaning of reactive enamine intermediates, YjgF/YER057c/UK114 family [Thorsellia anophelis DSM 18579]